MAQSSAQPESPGPAAQIPFGPLKGRAQLLPQFANLGRVRPFGPGEYVDLGNSGMANEMTYTTQLGNQWAVVPGLWLVNGVPTRVTEDQATEYAQQSGLIWPTFKSLEEADQFAQQREAVWQKTPHGRTDMQK